MKYQESKPSLEFININLLDIDDDRSGPYPASADEDQRLLESIERHGIGQALVVCKADGNRYLVIDGARRLKALRRLGHEDVPCMVHPAMTSGEIETLRFMLHFTAKSSTKADLAKQERKIASLNSATGF